VNPVFRFRLAELNAKTTAHDAAAPVLAQGIVALLALGQWLAAAAARALAEAAADRD
jgi:hypothetical protein